MGYKDFYIERVQKGNQYSIDAVVVSKPEWDRRRITECFHRWTLKPGNDKELICEDCLLSRPNEARRNSRGRL